MAHSYRGRPPDDAAAEDTAGRWCAWLRCGHCGGTTLHAVVVDALAHMWRREGCERERHDRLADRDRRRTSRRLVALAAEGVTIVQAPSSTQMSVRNSLVEVIEYAGARRFLIRVCMAAPPDRVLRAIELAEDILDSPDQLGPWADEPTGLWRGLAITDP